MQIQLLRPHTHAGIACAAGTTLDLRADQARWLIDAGVARAVSATPAQRPPSGAKAGPVSGSNPNPKPSNQPEESNP